MTKKLTQKRLQELMHYDPETGIFTRLISTCNSIKVGDVAGCKDGGGYLRISVEHKNYRAHRLAWLYMIGKFPVYEIDHLNGNGEDNRFCNLRDVRRKMNNQNRRKAQKNNKSTSLLGVYPNGNGFRVLLGMNGYRKYCGTFKTKKIAYEVFLNEKRKFHEGCTI